MPSKSEFSIRKLMPQRQRAGSAAAAPESQKTHWLQPKPLFAGRRGSADPAMLGGMESHREITEPVPFPDAAYSTPSPPFARQPVDFARTTRRPVSPAGLRRPVSPMAPGRSLSVPEVGEDAMRPPTPVLRASTLPSPLSFELDQGIVGDEPKAEAQMLRPEPPAQRPSRPTTPTRPEAPAQRPSRPRTPVLAPEPLAQRARSPSAPMPKTEPLPQKPTRRPSVRAPRPESLAQRPTRRPSVRAPRAERPAQRPNRPSTPLGISDMPVPDRRSSIVPVTVLPVKEEASPRRSKSPPVKVPVRRDSIKKHKKKRKSALSPKKAGRQQPRWTFTDNVTDLLGLQMFRRVEADETVTPEQVEAFRRKRQVEEEERISEEERLSEERLSEEERIFEERLSEERLSEEERVAGEGRASDDGDDTPLEPFYLDDLASRIEAMLASGPTTPEPEPSEPDGFHEPVRQDFSVRRKPIPDTADPIPIPPKNPARARARGLPTIPELRVTAADDNEPTAPPADPFESYEDDDFVFLRSTPCTLTMPSFRHGPIRIKKSDLEPVFDPDNTLDWTAFQMAIMGAGDFFCEEALSPRYSEEAEQAELHAWFDAFGFEGCGRLVTEDESAAEGAPEPSPSSGEFSPVSSPASSCSDEDLPIPIEAEFAAEFWYGGGGPAAKRWSVRGRRGRRPSGDSLPQSPMMPLDVAGRDKEVLGVAPVEWSGGAEVVPMGYNLSHDLGDFLTWEAENVYAFDVS